MNLLPSFPFAEEFGSRARSGPDAGAGPIAPLESAEDFARHVIFAICHASVTPSVGRRAYEHCLRALAMGATVRLGFRHPGKADAVDHVWRERERLFGEYLQSADRRTYLTTLPWIGPVTRNALARRLGLSGDEQRAVA